MKTKERKAKGKKVAIRDLKPRKTAGVKGGVLPPNEQKLR